MRLGFKLPSDLDDRVSGLWYGLAIVMFTPSFTALVVWDKERLLLRRESATGNVCERNIELLRVCKPPDAASI